MRFFVVSVTLLLASFSACADLDALQQSWTSFSSFSTEAGRPSEAMGQLATGSNTHGRHVLQGTYPPAPTGNLVTLFFQLSPPISGRIAGGARTVTITRPPTGRRRSLLQSHTTTTNPFTTLHVYSHHNLDHTQHDTSETLNPKPRALLQADITLEEIANALFAAYPTATTITLTWTPSTAILQVAILFPASVTSLPTSLQVQDIITRYIASKPIPIPTTTIIINIYIPARYDVVYVPLRTYRPPVVVLPAPTPRPAPTTVYVYTKPRAPVIRFVTPVSTVAPVTTSTTIYTVTGTITVPSVRVVSRAVTVTTTTCRTYRTRICSLRTPIITDVTFVACRILSTTTAATSVTISPGPRSTFSYTLIYPTTVATTTVTTSVTTIKTVVGNAFNCVARRRPSVVVIAKVLVPIRFYEVFVNVARYHSNWRF